MKSIKILMVSLFITGCASIPTKHIVSHIALTMDGFCAAGDLATTMYWRGARKVYETNGFLAPVQDFPISFTVRKYSLEAGLFSTALILDKKEHPTASTVISMINAVTKCTLMFRNDKIGRGN